MIFLVMTEQVAQFFVGMTFLARGDGDTTRTPLINSIAPTLPEPGVIEFRGVSNIPADRGPIRSRRTAGVAVDMACTLFLRETGHRRTWVVDPSILPQLGPKERCIFGDLELTILPGTGTINRTHHSGIAGRYETASFACQVPDRRPASPLYSPQVFHLIKATSRDSTRDARRLPILSA